MNTPLASAYAKLGRANVHAHELNASIARFKYAHPEPHMRMRQEIDHETGDGRMVVVELLEHPREWSLIVGDYLNNARTALDHLAWHLVTHGSEPNPANPTRVQFPIYESEAMFDREVGNRLPGVDDFYRSIVRDCQPFPSKAGRGPLKLLNEFVRHDKHRQVHVVEASSIRFRATVTGSSDYTVASFGPGPDTATVPFIPKVGTELVRFCGTVTGPKPNVGVHMEGSYAPSFPDGQHVEATLNSIGEVVSFVLGLFNNVL